MALFYLAVPGVVSAMCGPLPSGTLPLSVGDLVVDTIPGTGAKLGIPPNIRFNHVSVVVKQRPTTEALEITFETGSVGPARATQRDDKGATLRVDVLPTYSLKPGQVTYRYYTRGAFDVLFESENHEGALISVCEAFSAKK